MLWSKLITIFNKLFFDNTCQCQICLKEFPESELFIMKDGGSGGCCEDCINRDS